MLYNLKEVFTLKKTIFTGSAVAIVTPMNNDGSVNYTKLKELIDFQIKNSTDAIIICGTTGESSALNHEEHCKVIQTCIDHTAKRIPVIAGTGSNDTAYAVELSVEAEKMGADGLLMVTPYYNKTSQLGLIRHYNYIADRVNVPIILYNVPSRTGVNILPETYVELAKHQNIAAIKEANGNIAALAHTVALCGDNIDIYSGNDDQIVPFMSLGAKGVISVFANILPKESHDIAQACLDGNFRLGAKLQTKYIKLMNALFSDVNPIPVKTAMNLMGLDVGPCRMTLTNMPEALENKLKDTMKEYGLI